MPLAELENLVTIGKLHEEAPSAQEFAGLKHSGSVRLRDAQIASLSLESRFDLAYNAAHAFALAALRFHGYRATNRYLVFQCREHTVGMPASQWRVLSNAHNKRNRAEYEGDFGISATLCESVLRVTRVLEKLVKTIERNSD